MNCVPSGLLPAKPTSRSFPTQSRQADRQHGANHHGARYRQDGKVSLAEAAKYGAPGSRDAENGQSVRARQLLTIDGASKGTLTFAEYQAAGEALFRQIDTDKDGVVSQQELTDYRTRAERVGCEMPAASEKAKVVLLSSYETEALSSVTLGSQDNVVQAGRVVVEPGDEPLYVVIASYSPTIWQFSGAVERIERLIMASSQRAKQRRSQSALAGRRHRHCAGEGQLLQQIELPDLFQ